MQNDKTVKTYFLVMSFPLRMNGAPAFNQNSFHAHIKSKKHEEKIYLAALLMLSNARRTENS